MEPEGATSSLAAPAADGQAPGEDIASTSGAAEDLPQCDAGTDAAGEASTEAGGAGASAAPGSAGGTSAAAKQPKKRKPPTKPGKGKHAAAGKGAGKGKNAAAGKGSKPGAKGNKVPYQPRESQCIAARARTADLLARPLPAFALFGFSQRGVLKKQKTTGDVREMVKAIGERWLLLPEEGRAKYEKMAAEDERRSYMRAAAAPLTPSVAAARELLLPVAVETSIARLANPTYYRRGAPVYTGAWADAAFDPELPGARSHADHINPSPPEAPVRPPG